jgi:hypothetical protein
MDPYTGDIKPVGQDEEIEFSLFYLRYDSFTRSYVWVTERKWDEVIEGSKVKGWRLRFRGDLGQDWFTLKAGGRWTRVSDSVRPCIFRRTQTGVDYTASCEPDDWQKPPPPPVKPPKPVDPPPPPKPAAPTCTLSASPTTLRLGDTILLSLDIKGEATEAKLDGEPVDLKLLKRIRIPIKTGHVLARATVTGPGGQGICEAEYWVAPETAPLDRTGRPIFTDGTGPPSAPAPAPVRETAPALPLPGK